MKKLIHKAYLFFGNIQTFLLTLIAATIPLKINLGNAAIIINFVYALFLIAQKRVSIKNFKSFYFYIPVLLFLIAIASALSSKDIEEGIFQLEKLTFFVLIPTILCTFKEKNIDFEKISFGFLLSVSVSTSILLANNLIKFINGTPSDQLFFFDFTNPYDQHPIYFSIYILMSILFIAYYFSYQKMKFLSFKLAACMVIILTTGLIFCASKIIIACFVLFLIVYLFYSYKKHRKKFLIPLALLIGVISMTMLVPNLNERFSTGLNLRSNDFLPTTELVNTKKFTYQEKKNISDLELRIIFIKIGLYHTIEDGKLLFGYGLGDVQNYMDYYYMSYNLAPNWYEGFNLHNQYLQYLATYGTLALLLLIVYLLSSLRASIRTRNIMHLFFVIMIMIVFTFEVYLARNKGIVLLLFFNSLFLIQKTNCANSNFRH